MTIKKGSAVYIDLNSWKMRYESSNLSSASWQALTRMLDNYKHFFHFNWGHLTKFSPPGIVLKASGCTLNGVSALPTPFHHMSHSSSIISHIWNSIAYIYFTQRKQSLYNSRFWAKQWQEEYRVIKTKDVEWTIVDVVRYQEHQFSFDY